MEYKDVKRYQIYKHYSGLHEFSAQDITSNTLEERQQTQKSTSKLAIEIKTRWPEKKKINAFTKYEIMNLKTYKCRNKNNISPIVNSEFDPKKMVMKNTDKLYEPRVQAYQAIKMHLDNVEQASATWLHNRSVNAMEHLSGTLDETEEG